MEILPKLTKAYLVLFVLFALAMLFGPTMAPVNIMPNPGNFTGTAALLNPNYRPQPGQPVPVFSSAPQLHLDPAPDLQLLLTEPTTVWQ